MSPYELGYPPQQGVEQSLMLKVTPALFLLSHDKLSTLENVLLSPPTDEGIRLLGVSM